MFTYSLIPQGAGFKERHKNSLILAQNRFSHIEITMQI